VLQRYDRSFTVLDDVVRAVPASSWADPSPCPGWTTKDVLAHLLWGQDLVAAWAAGNPPAAPGDQDWTQGVPDDELAQLWTMVRTRTRQSLTPEVMAREVHTRLFGTITIKQFLWTFPNDALLHAWDVATATGVAIELPRDIIDALLQWSQDTEEILRLPGGFGPRRPVAEDADLVDRWLAFAGREVTTSR